jgi:hypothetical protein
VLFRCDEYHAFATAGEEDASGDDRFFALSRQRKCIPIVATQSLNSLKSALPGESWRTLLQTFRTKVFLALSDYVSARIASEMVGKAERLVPNYHLAESGQDARISMPTGRAAAHRSSIRTSKSYGGQRQPVFEPKVFAELKTHKRLCWRTTATVRSRRPTATSSRGISIDPARTSSRSGEGSCRWPVVRNQSHDTVEWCGVRCAIGRRGTHRQHHMGTMSAQQGPSRREVTTRGDHIVDQHARPSTRDRPAYAQVQVQRTRIASALCLVRRAMT